MNIHETIIFIHIYMSAHKHTHRHIYKYYTDILTVTFNKGQYHLHNYNTIMFSGLKKEGGGGGGGGGRGRNHLR